MWHAGLGGLPPEDFLVKLDPLLKGVRAKLDGVYATSDEIGGHLSAEWAEKLGLKAGIPIPVGAFDAHWDALGAGPQGRRRGQRRRHLHLHRRLRRQGAAGAGRLRRGEGQRPSRLHRHRGGPFGGRRHLQRHRAGAPARRWANSARGSKRYRAGQTGPVALSLGQRRPHGAGQRQRRRHDDRLEPLAHRAGRAFRRDRRHRLPHPHRARPDGRIRRRRAPTSSTAAASRRTTRC